MLLAVTYSRDPDGREVVSVPLTNSPERAYLFHEDFERITSGHPGLPKWFLNDNGKGQVYVRTRDPETGTNVMVARLVMGEPAGRVIKHRYGDRLDLRSTNLDVCRAKKREGVWEFRAASWAAPAQPTPAS